MESECIVQLRSANPEFANVAEQAGLTVKAHSSSGLNWLIRGGAKACADVKNVPGVVTVQEATRAILSLEEGHEPPQEAIEKLGGIVLERLQNVNVAVVAVPANAAAGLKQMPGVTRVRKDYPVSMSSGKQ